MRLVDRQHCIIDVVGERPIRLARPGSAGADDPHVIVQPPLQHVVRMGSIEI